MLFVATLLLGVKGGSHTSPDIPSIATSTGNHNVLVEALATANLVDTLKTDGPFTVFAPTDDAFIALLGELGVTKEELLAREDLASILLYHVVAGKVMSSALAPEQKVDSLSPYTHTDVVELDWAKCCDCEENPLKERGQPCTVELKLGQKLRLKYESSQWMHNLYQVESQADLDTCVTKEEHAIVGSVGGQSMDVTLMFDAAGTYFYHCSVMCTDATAPGGEANAEYCHCSTFAHKLVVTVVQGGAPMAITSGADGVKVNGESSVTAADVEGSNGVVHVVDKVLLPPEALPLDIPAVAASTGVHNVLLDALQKTHLISALVEAGPFTVFAPTDAAFLELIKELGVTTEELLAREDLKSILLYHVVAGKVMSSDLTAEQKVDTLAEGKLTVTKETDLRKMSETDASTGISVNGVASVAIKDVAASNGVVHVIDKVLLPPTEGHDGHDHDEHDHDEHADEEAPTDSSAAMAALLVLAGVLA